jgi:hypothetical protein
LSRDGSHRELRRLQGLEPVEQILHLMAPLPCDLGVQGQSSRGPEQSLARGHWQVDVRITA